MQNYPFKQLTKVPQQQLKAKANTVSGSVFAQQREAPFGQPAASASSGSAASQKKLNFSQQGVAVQQHQQVARSLGGKLRAVGQNGALLANITSRVVVPGIGGVATSNVQNHAQELMKKIDYNDSYGKRPSSNYNSSTEQIMGKFRTSSVVQQQPQMSSVQQMTQRNISLQMTTTTFASQHTRQSQLFNSLNAQANSEQSESVEVDQRRSSSGDCKIVESEVSRPSGNLLSQFLNRAKGNNGSTLANRVYGRSNTAMRQFNAATTKASAPVETRSLLEAQERSMLHPNRTSSCLTSSDFVGKFATHMKTNAFAPTASARPSSSLERMGQQQQQSEDQEMIELDDDSDTIDIEALEAALNAPSPKKTTDAYNRASFQLKSKQLPAFLDRSKSTTGKESYTELFDNSKSYFEKRFQKPSEQSVTSLNAIDKLKHKFNQKQAVNKSGSSFTVASIRPLPQSARTTTNKLNVGNPLLSGSSMGDYQLNRILAKKRRENEEKSKKEQADEAAKLVKRMAMLKKEAQRRKQRQENDEFDAIMGIPKPEKYSKKKSAEKSNFAFLDDDLGEGVAALLDQKHGGGVSDGGKTSAARNAAEQAQIDADLIQQRREEQERKELEAHHKMIRFHNRNRVDELIQPILSLELVNKFFVEDPQGTQLAQIPSSFTNHEEYMDAWMPLFLFETYNQLISQKGASIKDRELAEQLGLSDRANRQFHFETIIEKSKVDADYVHLRLFEADNIQGIDDNRGFAFFPMLHKMRENDLLLLSEQPLEGAHNNSVKKICNAEFLMQMVNKKREGIFLASVFHSRAKDTNFVDVRVDAGFVEKYFLLNQMTLFQQQMRLHCYYFDSLTTIVREFLTIKKSEFYAVHDIIMNPVLALKNIEQKKISNDENGQIASAGGEKTWKQWANAHSAQAQSENKADMKSFISRNAHTFNESQLEALTNVSEMHEKDLLLIQGPPGTGKTHTIHGIISMINSCQKRQILVCAPSNAAIDEIVSRISKDKYSTYTKDKILRVGAMDYEPSPDVKMHTLDYKLEKAIMKFQSGNDVGANDRDDNHQKRENEHNTASGGSQASPSYGSPIGQGTKKSVSTAAALDLSPEQTKKALEAIQNALLILQRKEHTDQKITDLVRPLFKSQTQFDHFLKVQNRCQKIDRLDAIRKQLEPKKSQAGFGVRLNHQSRGKNQSMVGGKPITQAKKRNLMLQILNAAQIVCTTLSMSASEMFNNFSTGSFAYLIVDEACQSVELTNLIPFQHEPKKVILVGDQKQLPATVFSSNGNETRYSRSMFERFLECGVKNYMLQIQYRMHPQIRALPSKLFYQDKLRDDKSILERQMSETLARATRTLNLQPVMFFDLQYSRESANETSKQNQDEVRFIKELLFVLAKTVSPNKYNSSDLSSLKGSIGIISPYKSQVRQIRDAINRVRHRLVLSGDADIEVNTVDGYQGREKDIIIISTVRTNALGFLKDYRRMNVAITRARHMLWIVGQEKSLRQDPNWNALIQDGCQKAYHFAENPFQDKVQQGEYNHHGANKFIESTLMTQQVVPLMQAKKKNQQNGGVQYDDIFSPAITKGKVAPSITKMMTIPPVMSNSNETSREKETNGGTIRPANLSHQSGAKIVEKGVINMATSGGHQHHGGDRGPSRENQRQKMLEKDNDQARYGRDGKRSYRDRSPHASDQMHNQRNQNQDSQRRPPPHSPHHQNNNYHQPAHNGHERRGGYQYNGGRGRGRGRGFGGHGDSGGDHHYREGGGRQFRDNNSSSNHRRDNYHNQHRQQSHYSHPQYHHQGNKEHEDSRGQKNSGFASKRQKY